MARERPDDYRRMLAVARNEGADDYSWILSAALAAVIEGEADLAKKVRQRAMKFVDGPIRSGHVPFGTDLALCGIAYDLCFDAWSPDERERFHSYFNRTVDANVQSETHVFHNAWYGYKNWGIGVAGYASYHENPRAPRILRVLEEDYRARAAPALELAGDGGGRTFGGDRDKALSARRILVNRFGDRPPHGALRAFNETTPRSGVGNYAYKDFLWRGPAGKAADIRTLPLSHVSAGPGFVYARSSWDDDATYFFFKCGDRFTAHQHLDVNHFVVFKHEELAGDATRAYASNAVACFTRQMVFLRPDTFVVFDRVEAVRPEFRKTWLLQAMKTPVRSEGRLVITHGKGRLFVQTLLPRDADVRLASGDDLYRYGGQAYPPGRDTGPVPECRVEVSPSRPQARDFFLHVLTAASADTASVPAATVETRDERIEVSLGEARMEFLTARVGGAITLGGESRALADRLVALTEDLSRP